jgi:superfamily II DNA or RNA helicase
MQLFPYQQDLVNNIREQYIQGSKSVLAVLPTGGGKTIVFSQVTQTAQSRGKCVWILVHRIELLRQTSDKLNQFGVEHGLINPRFSPKYYESVQVASVQTLVNRLDKLPAPDLIIIDECHHTVAGSWKKIIDYHPNALILGVTATPVRGDGKGLGAESGGVFDSMVQGPQVNELIDMNRLCKPIIYAPSQALDLTSLRTVRGDYDAKQVEELMDKPTITGDAVSHYSRLCPGTPAVAFCASVKHAEHVAEEFTRHGFRAYSVDGSMDDETRGRILGGLADGSVDVVTSCDIISEGTDIPAIGCAIFLRPTQSTGLYIQQAGRALRVVPGKDHAYILDHVGNCLRHGLPDEPREWSLSGTKKKRGKSVLEQTIRVEQCPNCYMVHAPMFNCPGCGHVYETKSNEIETVDGELREITASERAAIKRQMSIEVAQARTLEDLKNIEKQRGYKRGWAYNVFMSRKI